MTNPRKRSLRPTPHPNARRAGPPPPPRPAGRTADPPAGGPGFGRGPMGMVGMPAAKAMTFGPSARRLMGRLAPERGNVAAVVLLAVIAVGFTVAGPKLLGRATDIIFAGVLGRQLPPGMTTEQAAHAARASGHGNVADLITRMHVVPGRASTSAPSAPSCSGRSACTSPPPCSAGCRAICSRRGPADDLPAAHRRRGQAAPAAARVLRPPAPRGAAQPGHQRHRQRRAEPAADAEPTAHLAAHRRSASSS